MVGTRRGMSTYGPVKKTKKKNVIKNYKVVIDVHGIQIKGIAIRGNDDGKSEGVSSPPKPKEFKQKSLKKTTD